MYRKVTLKELQHCVYFAKLMLNNDKKPRVSRTMCLSKEINQKKLTDSCNYSSVLTLGLTVKILHPLDLVDKLQFIPAVTYFYTINYSFKQEKPFTE